jgi:hypothetical protein
MGEITQCVALALYLILNPYLDLAFQEVREALHGVFSFI